MLTEPIADKLASWQEQRQQAAEAEAMESARLRMREHYNQAAQAEQLKREQAEALKR